MACVKKIADECSKDHYPNDKTCKACRRLLVKLNRQKKILYYQEYDKKRYKNDPRVRERHRRYQKTEAGKKSINQAKRRYLEKNPIKRLATNIVNNAVRDGKLSKPDFCSICGASGRIHGHHDDYAKPLVVRWLCPACHMKWHDINGEGLNG